MQFDLFPSSPALKPVLVVGWFAEHSASPRYWRRDFDAADFGSPDRPERAPLGCASVSRYEADLYAFDHGYGLVS